MFAYLFSEIILHLSLTLWLKSKNTRQTERTNKKINRCGRIHNNIMLLYY